MPLGGAVAPLVILVEREPVALNADRADPAAVGVLVAKSGDLAQDVGQGLEG